MDAERLPAFADALFGYAKPSTVLMSTPNSEYNVLFDGMEPGALRHPDHRFEWTRSEFEDWSKAQAEKFGFDVSFTTIGDVHEEHGAPTQMAVFKKEVSQ